MLEDKAVNYLEKKQTNTNSDECMLEQEKQEDSFCEVFINGTWNVFTFKMVNLAQRIYRVAELVARERKH